MPMFQARMTQHELKKKVEVDDGLGFTYSEYGEPQTILLYLTKPTPTDYNQNEYYTKQYDATAFTYESVGLGDLVDGSWEVANVEKIKGNEYVLGLVAYAK